MCSQNAGNGNVISEPLILKFFQGACLWTPLEVTKYEPPIQNKNTTTMIDSISKEINYAEHEYMNMSPPLIELATPLIPPRYLIRHNKYIISMHSIMVNLACILLIFYMLVFFLSYGVNCYKILIMLSSHGSSTIYRNNSVVNSVMKTFAILLVLVLIVALGNCTDPSENEIGVNRSK